MQEQVNKYKKITLWSTIFAVLIILSHIEFNKMDGFVNFLWFLSIFLVPFIPCYFAYLWYARTKDIQELKEIIKYKHKAVREKAQECLYFQDINITYMTNQGVRKTLPNKHVYTQTYVENVMIGKTSTPMVKTRIVTEYKFSTIVKTISGKLYGFTDSEFMNKEVDFYLLPAEKTSDVLTDCEIKHTYIPFHDDYFRRGEECIELF